MDLCNINVVANNKETDLTNVQDILSVFEKIKNGHVDREIQQIRNANDKAHKNKLKGLLPAFTVSATFNDRRKKDQVNHYNGLIHLDYDGVDNPAELKSVLTNLETTFCAFISPSGKGLKVFIKTNATLDYHEQAFKKVRSIYDSYSGIVSDNSVKDVTRLCYISSDPALYLHSDSIVFDAKESIDCGEGYQDMTPEQAFSYTSNIYSFSSGTRNIFTYTYACNTNKYGITESDALDYFNGYAETDFTCDEIQRTVENAYKQNSHEFAMLQYCNIATSDIPTLQSPFISDDIYGHLPKYLKEACAHFTGRERDVFLIASLTALSGYFSNVKGSYDRKLVYPNLYSFIIANAASGKSAAKYAKVFGKEHHQQLKNSTQESMTEYRKAKADYDKSKHSKKTTNIQEPELPKQLMFFIPGDTSEASLVGHIADNLGKGCVFETEADTISGANKQEWGGFSPVLRKNFHHEDISRSRKTDNEFTEITNSRFSFLTTGTPDQVNKLIPNAEDGLYSRFLFYTYSIPIEWRDTYTRDIGDSLDVVLSKLGESFYTNHKNGEERSFRLTPEQGRKLDTTFKEQIKKMKAKGSPEEAYSVLFRLGLMAYKLAMILSAMESKDTEIQCSDKTIDLSIKLILEVFLVNSVDLLERMSKSTAPSLPRDTALLNALPIEFDRKQAIEQAVSMGIKNRTADGMLSTLVERHMLVKQQHGVYRKVDA